MYLKFGQNLEKHFCYFYIMYKPLREKNIFLIFIALLHGNSFIFCSNT